MASVKKTIEESLQNIQDDRKLTLDLLKELRAEINSGETNHGRSGVIAAKYVETLQRSNEQLVKLCGLMSKQENTEELTDKDFAQIFDQIQKSEDD